MDENGTRVSSALGAGRNLIWDDRAQATVEYILMLAVVVGLFLIVYRALLKPILGFLMAHISTTITGMFTVDKLHQLPFSPPK